MAHNSHISSFKALAKEQELALLQSDDADLTRTHRYLVPLIETALQKFEIDSDTHRTVTGQLFSDIPIAVERFFEHNRQEESYSFATYFTWYISERINKIPNLKRRK